MNKLIVILILASSFWMSCSTTKSLKDGEVLYRGERIKFEKKPSTTNWKVENSDEKYANVYWELWNAPNGALLGMPVTTFFPLRLYIYHDFYNEKSKGFNHWVRGNFGEKPITIQYINPEMEVKKGVSIFEEYGHFGTTGEYKLNYSRKGNKAYIRYYFTLTEAYKYRSVNYEGVDYNATLKNVVSNVSRTSELKPGLEFNLYKIREEKSRFANVLQDSGYYFIIDKNIRITADTTIGGKMLDLKMSIDDNLPLAYYRQQYLNDIQINLDSIIQPKNPGKYYEWGFGKIKSNILDAVIDIHSQSKYSKLETQRTNFLLSELGVFSNPRIAYKVVEGDSLTLNPVITLEALDATNIGFNIRGNYKNTGYIGPSMGFTFRQLNVFHGAEKLSVNGDVYYDIPIGILSHRVSNSYGFSLRSILSKPLLKTPFKFINHKYSLPKQFYKLNFEYNVRQDYFNIVTLNATYGWAWKSRPNISHTVGLLDVTMSDITDPTVRFDTLVHDNPLLRETLVNQFLLGSFYEFHFQEKATTFKRWDFNYTGRVEFTGNTMNILSSIFSNEPKGEKTFFGINYAQYTRLTSEIIANWHISKTHKLVFRNITGIGFAYGNSKNMPFIKQYFIGGTNSLRPFSARTIGPGRYLQVDPAEVNQVGDFKLEINVEYRFPLVWKLNMAIFSDMGNIWLLNPDPNRPGGEVRWNKLVQDSYLTAGVGLRFDIDYLVLRFDVGLPVYNPVVVEGNRWVWENKVIKWAPVIGIGYPF